MKILDITQNRLQEKTEQYIMKTCPQSSRKLICWQKKRQNSYLIHFILMEKRRKMISIGWL
nr:MAG TPA: hypothetical protein [Caudoviricetes sp.]